ncbi:MAG: phosphotransferase family protein [Ktedonobacterales bacterium]
MRPTGRPEPTPLPPRDAQALADLIKETFGATCTISGHQSLVHDHDYWVVRLWLAQPTLQVVVKLAGLQARIPCPFERMEAINRLVRTHTNVPNNGIIATDTSQRRWPWRYLIMTHIEGYRWANVLPHVDAEQAADVRRQLGIAVATLHNIHFAQFGEIDASGTIPFGAKYLQALTQRLEKRITHPRRAANLSALFWERSRLFSDVRDAGLTHENLTPANIMLRQDSETWSVAGILDFDDAWAGCPESDLARMESWRGMIGPGFWEGYQSVRQVGSSYAQRRALLQLLWCLEYAEYAGITPPHMAEIQRVCMELGVNPALFV